MFCNSNIGLSVCSGDNKCKLIVCKYCGDIVKPCCFCSCAGGKKEMLKYYKARMARSSNEKITFLKDVDFDSLKWGN